MKKFFLATVATFGITSAAAAEGLLPVPVMGSIEYATEASTTSIALGTEMTVGQFSLMPMFNLSDTSGEFDFDGLEITAVYSVTDGVNVFATVETDNEWGYAETTIGAAFRF